MADKYFTDVMNKDVQLDMVHKCCSTHKIKDCHVVFAVNESVKEKCK